MIKKFFYNSGIDVNTGIKRELFSLERLSKG